MRSPQGRPAAPERPARPRPVLRVKRVTRTLARRSPECLEPGWNVLKEAEPRLRQPRPPRLQVRKLPRRSAEAAAHRARRRQPQPVRAGLRRTRLPSRAPRSSRQQERADEGGLAEVRGRGKQPNQAITILRRALGDRRDSPQFVRTVAGRGYRFVGEVVEEPATGGPDEPAGQSPLAESRLESDAVSAEQKATPPVPPHDSRCRGR